MSDVDMGMSGVELVAYEAGRADAMRDAMQAAQQEVKKAMEDAERIAVCANQRARDAVMAEVRRQHAEHMRIEANRQVALELTKDALRYAAEAKSSVCELYGNEDPTFAFEEYEQEVGDIADVLRGLEEYLETGSRVGLDAARRYFR